VFALRRLGVCAALVFAGCGMSGGFGGATTSGIPDQPDDRDAVALVPAGVETVIDVDMSLLRRSAWTATVLQARDDHAHRMKIEGLGYDDVADLDRIIYAVTPAGADAPTLVVAQGRIPRAAIQDAFRTRWTAAIVDRWRGISVLSSGENAIAVLTDRTFASGTPVMVRAVIDRAFGVGAAAMTDSVLAPVRRALVSPGRVATPALLVTSTISDRMRARIGDAAPVPHELRQIGIRMDVGQSLDLEAVGILDDRASAAALSRRLGLMLGDPAVRLGMRAIGLGDLLSGLHVAADGARVRVWTSVSDEHRADVTAALQTLTDGLRGGSSAGGLGSW
jgi:hypothetical protein